MDQIKLIEAFVADLKILGRSPDTIKQYPRCVKRLLEFSGGDLLKVDGKMMGEFVEYLCGKGISIVSVSRYVAALSTFFDFLVFKEVIERNPITPAFRGHYFRGYKPHSAAQRRQCIKIEQAKLLLHSILDIREQAVVCLLLKTGIRRKEVSELDLVSVDIPNLTLHVRPTGKRSGEVIYFDDEMAFVFKKWLKRRQKMDTKGSPAFFLDRFGNRLSPNAIDMLFSKHAKAVGLHNPQSKRLEDRLSPHSCRHFFTTWMIDAGMQREFIAQLRGDHSGGTIGVYYHPSPQKVKESYMACAPKFGLM